MYMYKKSPNISLANISSYMYMHNKALLNLFYLILRSVLTPGGCSALTIAHVDTLSMIVAVNPPCNVPPRLACSSSTVNSQLSFPLAADTILTWK